MCFIFDMKKSSHFNNNKEEEIKLNYTENIPPVREVRILSLHEKCGNLSEWQSQNKKFKEDIKWVVF